MKIDDMKVILLSSFAECGNKRFPVDFFCECLIQLRTAKHRHPGWFPEKCIPFSNVRGRTLGGVTHLIIPLKSHTIERICQAGDGLCSCRIFGDDFLDGYDIKISHDLCTLLD